MSLFDTGAAQPCDGEHDVEAADPAAPSPTALLDIYWPYLWDERTDEPTADR